MICYNVVKFRKVQFAYTFSKCKLLHYFQNQKCKKINVTQIDTTLKIKEIPKS